MARPPDGAPGTTARVGRKLSADFGDKHALVSAEIARLEGRDADAMRLYEQAIRSARENGFVQNEGLANEVAARFYAARGFETIANAYLRNARYCYLRWGADGKVRQLDRLLSAAAARSGHPSARRPLARRSSSSTWRRVVKASQAVSSEIVLDQADRAADDDRARECRRRSRPSDTAGRGRPFRSRRKPGPPAIRSKSCCARSLITASDCPESLVRYVIRTRESVILDDASRPNLFSEDDYLRGRPAKSILCLPLIKQGRLIGVLYLENNADAARLHAGPDRGPGAVGVASGDLAGEHPSLQRSPGTRGEGPAPGRIQYYWDLFLGF